VGEAYRRAADLRIPWITREWPASDLSHNSWGSSETYRNSSCAFHREELERYDLRPLPANTLVVRTAPQIELLKHAVLCITHAGLNAALEALAQGVPMVAIPIGHDQPGVAARIAHHGVGEFMEVDDLTSKVFRS
jgi:UDP:flavonoid glycosyltransferase YjiC (YdhE family)